MLFNVSPGTGGGILDTAQLDRIERKIEDIAGSGAGLVFSRLEFSSPTFSIDSNQGWTVSPIDLANIIDGDLNTSTNTFEISGLAHKWGDVIISPNIALPQFTRINLTLAIRSNNNGQRPAIQVDVLTSTWTNVWAVFGIPMSDTIETNFLVDAIVTVAWTQMRIRIWDLGAFGTRCRIFDLKLFSVS